MDPQSQQHPGGRIRAVRRHQNLSVRELARRASLTPSHVSKIERGVTNPSVGALWKISDVLGLSVAQLFSGTPPAVGLETPIVLTETGEARSTEDASPAEYVPSPGERPRPRSPVVEPDRRESIKMTGVEFQRLTPSDDDSIEFIEVRHEVGAGDEEAYHHRGREYGLVLQGRLQVEVGFAKHVLGPGFSIAFDSSIPHRVLNVGDEPAVAVWVTVGRNAPAGG